MLLGQGNVTGSTLIQGRLALGLAEGRFNRIETHCEIVADTGVVFQQLLPVLDAIIAQQFEKVNFDVSDEFESDGVSSD